MLDLQRLPRVDGVQALREAGGLGCSVHRFDKVLEFQRDAHACVLVFCVGCLCVLVAWIPFLLEISGMCDVFKGVLTIDTMYIFKNAS